MPVQGLKRAVVIIANRSLGLGNRLPKFKMLKDYKSFKLQSGKILGTLYNTPQICKGRGGGFTYISIQAKKATALQQPQQP